MIKSSTSEIEYDDPRVVAQVQDALDELRAMDATSMETQEKETGGSHGQREQEGA